MMTPIRGMSDRISLVKMIKKLTKLSYLYKTHKKCDDFLWTKKVKMAVLPLRKNENDVIIIKIRFVRAL